MHYSRFSRGRGLCFLITGLFVITSVLFTGTEGLTASTRADDLNLERVLYAKTPLPDGETLALGGYARKFLPGV